MSIWYEIKDGSNVELSADGTTVEVLFNTDYNGNNYVDIPIEFIKKALEE